MLVPLVVRSLSLPSSSWFICTQMWNHPLCQPLPCLSPLHPSCLSPPLLLVWMTAPSLTPWLSDFHTVRFSGSSGCILFLNLLLSFFGCARRHSVSTYASILSGSLELLYSIHLPNKILSYFSTCFCFESPLLITLL